MPVTDIVYKEKCTGCYACFSSCPKEAIRMQSADDGFKYPVVDRDKCIECNLCNKVCPVLAQSFPQQSEYERNVYAGWSNDIDNRLHSTSGGAFFEIARKWIEDAGCVAAARYDDSNLVVHDYASSLAELEHFRQSKYVQSDIGDVYKKIKYDLINGRKVLFCGTPCQVVALKSCLMKDYDNLMTIDFICRGVNSPKAYSAWLNEIGKKEKSKIIKVWFKNKTYGWKNSPWCTKIEFANGKEKLFYQKDNLYMRGYLIDNLYMRHCCGECMFKQPQCYADITLGDFWGADKSIDDDNGTSVIFVNSEKGAKAIKRMSESMHLEIINSGVVESGNICLNNSPELNPRSKSFLRTLDKYSFSTTYLLYRIHNKAVRLINR